MSLRPLRQPSGAASSIRPARIGLFGKLPARRDFITHDVDAAVLGLVEPWLHASLHASRAALGLTWEAAYMDAPIWRFRCRDARLGGAMRGVLMASVDGIGRKFPLLALSDPRWDKPCGLTRDEARWEDVERAGDRAWFDAAEDIVLEALEEDAALETVFANAARSAAWLDAQKHETPSASLSAAPTPSQDGACLWWAPALAPQVPPLAFAAAFPPPDAFADLLTGRFAVPLAEGAAL